MKKLLMMLVLLPLMSLAQTEVVDGITWTCRVTGNGEAGISWADSSSMFSTWSRPLPSTHDGCPVTSTRSSADIDITDIRAFSGWPWKEVVIGYTINGREDEALMLELTARDNVSGRTYVCKTLEGVDLTPGSHVVKWNASADGAKFKSNDVVFTARIVQPPLYCVIDLSGGTSAASYPVTGLADVPNGGWTEECKTNKLVLRRIKAGTFKMGDVGRDGTMYDITLTKPYYRVSSR